MRKEQRQHLERIAISLYSTPKETLDWFLDIATEPAIRRAVVILLLLSDGVPRSNSQLSDELSTHPDLADLTPISRFNEISQTLNSLLKGGVPFTSISSTGRGHTGAWRLNLHGWGKGLKVEG